MSGDCSDDQPVIFYCREMTITKKILLSREAGVKFAYDIFKTEKELTKDDD
tara:strand:- start:50 stop:202 length:153 start_codon:yes stop_codon:yes gene_type:complete